MIEKPKKRAIISGVRWILDRKLLLQRIVFEKEQRRDLFYDKEKNCLLVRWPDGRRSDVGSYGWLQLLQ